MTPSTNWRETVAADEAERFERYADFFEDVQKRRAANGALSRALHAKGNAGLEAELTVLPDLPEHARIGIFASPKTYRAYVRYSNGSAMRQPDGKPDVRGIALKIVGVPGKKVIPGLEDAVTHDFLMVRSSAIPFKNAAEFVGFVRAAQSPLLLLPRVFFTFGFARAIELLKELKASLSQPMKELAATSYYTGAPTQFGKYAARYALIANDAPDPNRTKKTDPEHLSAELAERLRTRPVTYDFRVQFFVDEQRTPIEDASVDWLDEHAPYVTLAKLTLPAQDVASSRGRKVAELVEKLSFDPWHAPVEFRPLGSIMRARNHAYRRSTMKRKAIAEPDGTEKLD